MSSRIYIIIILYRGACWLLYSDDTIRHNKSTSWRRRQAFSLCSRDTERERARENGEKKTDLFLFSSGAYGERLRRDESVLFCASTILYGAMADDDRQLQRTGPVEWCVNARRRFLHTHTHCANRPLRARKNYQSAENSRSPLWVAAVVVVFTRVESGKREATETFAPGGEFSSVLKLFDVFSRSTECNPGIWWKNRFRNFG